MKLITFCANHKAGLDAQAIATIVDYVLGPKANKEADLPKFQDATGAYYEFDNRINFPIFLQYAYSSKVPPSLLNPSSLRYSLWTDLTKESPKLPSSWKLPLPAGQPVIIHGLERDGITPDLTSGVYYDYNLKRTLIHLNHKGRHVLISISKQIGISDVGKKGFILGNDDDWNYYYSGEPGSAMAGLGWVKAYSYDFFSVVVFVESGSSPAIVRSGTFQWIRAGWSGINFVKTEHVIKGMKRNARNVKTILESPNLPAPSKIASTYQQFSALPRNDLVKRYTSLQQARQSLAVQNGKIKTHEIKKQDSYSNTPKEQIIEELMIEYLKNALGKPSLLEKKVVFHGSL
ncbi:MAG: hypothetical protein PHN75_04455 [Syntrophales bacterium]|nr:hypothetical protein [Syntrophales bacterium]